MVELLHVMYSNIYSTMKGFLFSRDKTMQVLKNCPSYLTYFFITKTENWLLEI